MVYYVTLLSCACIGIVGASQMMRRSASVEEHPHHLRGTRGSGDGRRNEKTELLLSYSGRTSGPRPDIRRLNN
jgi:hypothetical protein